MRNRTVHKRRALLGLALLACTPLLLGFLCFPLVPLPPSGVPTPVPNALFAPTVSASVPNPTPGAPSAIVAHLSFPEGSTLAIGATFDIPAGWSVAGDAAVTDGAIVGQIVGFMTIDNPDPTGLTPFGCNTTVEFDPLDVPPSDIKLLEATTNTSSKVSGTDTNGNGKPDVIDDANLNGLPDGVDKYPAFLNTILPGTHKARYFGHTEVAGISDLYLNVVVMELAAGGPYRVVTIVNDPTSRPESATNRFCAPLSTTMTLSGVSADNPATVGGEGGQNVYVNPGAGAYKFGALLVSEFDHDNDGVSNGLDNCPFTSNPSQLDSDEDFVGDACETDAVPNFDVDGDGLENGYDNCIFVANPSQADSDFDDIGDACDGSPSVPNGPNYVLTCSDQVGIGQADPGPASCTAGKDPNGDTDGDTIPNALDDDDDDDGCPDERELQTAPGSEQSGGRRDPHNRWDYFNASKDGQNRVDDILLVVMQYFIDAPSPNYTTQTDRTALGPNLWNLGPPNGQQRVDDILAQVYQYFHDCS